ncbi:aspartyl protease family protein [Mucilaginibacter sp. X4EP1]|jgi:hypothetical protein|uniref:aspartyl protease family protein n=1 Tax=Mucilaginibacter sp. X4EP1 TaxID=2723092 RepID=UPI00216A23D0|nr:aspartyl protease family protein [Mucilaginibacter sp. X4EP1]MCS3812989.1 hypothetical protein [Mucilaginibacter sp. X4EP1]
MQGKRKNFTIPIKIIDLYDDGFHPLIEVSIFEKKFTLVLDTGASKTAFDHSMLLQTIEDLPITGSDRLSSGLGTNSMTSSTANIKEFHIGDLLIEELEVAVLDLSAINIAYQQFNLEILGVLGGDILMKYKAIINYGKQQLVLKK